MSSVLIYKQQTVHPGSKQIGVIIDPEYFFRPEPGNFLFRFGQNRLPGGEIFIFYSRIRSFSFNSFRSNDPPVRQIHQRFIRQRTVHFGRIPAFFRISQRFIRQRVVYPFKVKFRLLNFLFHAVSHKRRFKYKSDPGKTFSSSFFKVRRSSRIFVSGNDNFFPFFRNNIFPALLQPASGLPGSPIAQSIAHRSCHSTDNGKFRTESDLTLGRMHIDVDIFHRQFQKKHRRHIAARFGQCGIAIPESPGNRQRINRTAVDKKSLFPPGRTGQSRNSRKSGNTQTPLFVRKFNHILTAEKFPHTLIAAAFGKTENNSPVDTQFKGCFRICQSQKRHSFFNMMFFRSGRFHKFFPGRSIEKKIFHFYTGSGRTAAGDNTQIPAPFDRNFDTFIGIRTPGTHRKL